MTLAPRASALALGVLVLLPAAGVAQEPSLSPRVSTTLARSLAAAAAPVDGAQAMPPSRVRAFEPPPELPQGVPVRRGSGAKAFLADVGHDYVAWFSLDAARTLAVGSAAALAVHFGDGSVRSNTGSGFFEEVSEVSNGGQQYGNPSVQVPLALGWWAVGSAIGSGRHAEAGRDLVRAQISAMSWTYAIKYTVGRTRPNGDSRSFPSGHTSSTFATATVLQRHYGWKVGLPFYLLGAYTGASRIADDKHWTSDVVMGAVVGITAGRAVTMRMGKHEVRLSPAAAPGGMMVQFAVE